MTDKLEQQTQTVWGWPIAAHLFLAGAGGGSFAVGVLTGLAGWTAVSNKAILLAFPLLALDTILLIRDLGVKSHALRVFQHPGSSWIARGSWIISVVAALAFVLLLAMVQPGVVPVGLLPLVAALGLIGGILVMVYTGALLMASRVIAFWNSALLPVLFVISATGAAISLAVALTTPDAAALVAFAALARTDALLIVLELAVITFYIQSSHRTAEARASAHLLSRGRFAPMFWIGLVGVGLVVPLALEALAVAGGDLAAALWMVKAAAVARLIGAVMLPRLILAVGVRTPLRAAGIDFTFPTPALR